MPWGSNLLLRDEKHRRQVDVREDRDAREFLNQIGESANSITTWSRYGDGPVFTGGYHIVEQPARSYEDSDECRPLSYRAILEVDYAIAIDYMLVRRIQRALVHLTRHHTILFALPNSRHFGKRHKTVVTLPDYMVIGRFHHNVEAAHDWALPQLTARGHEIMDQCGVRSHTLIEEYRNNFAAVVGSDEEYCSLKLRL